VCLQRVGDPKQNYAKVGNMGVGVGSQDLLLNFGTSHISRMAETSDSKFCLDIEGWGPYNKNMQW